MTTNTYLASTDTYDSYIAIQKDGDWLYFKIDPTGIFGLVLTAKGDAYEKLSSDEKLDALKEIIRLRSHEEECDFKLDDICVTTGDFDVPEWLILDDYVHTDIDMILHSTTGARIDFYYDDGKPIAIFENSNESEVLESREFLKKLDAFYEQDVDAYYDEMENEIYKKYGLDEDE
jgi:hypothetical protein